MINLGRWIAIIPVAVVAWYGCFFVGVMTLFQAGQLCPPDEMVSGLCGAWWYGPLESTIEAAFVALSAIGVVCSSALMAPQHKVRVAWTAYVVGSVVAAWFMASTGALLDFVAAEVVGLAAAVLVHCHDQRAMLDAPAGTMPEVA
jgi:hypothetical protein